MYDVPHNDDWLVWCCCSPCVPHGRKLVRLRSARFQFLIPVVYNNRLLFLVENTILIGQYDCDGKRYWGILIQWRVRASGCSPSMEPLRPVKRRFVTIVDENAHNGCARIGVIEQALVRPVVVRVYVCIRTCAYRHRSLRRPDVWTDDERFY